MAVPTTRRRPRWPVPAVLRGLGVLLVLLGVVAMHQLTGGTHLATMTTARSRSHSRPQRRAQRGRPRGRGRRDGSDALACPSSTRSPPAGRSPGTAAMPLCLAVLTGLAILALPAATATARSTPTATPAVARHDTGPPGRGPPRDLLAQLCVLRT